MQDRALHREAEARPVLVVRIDDEHVVIAQRCSAAFDQIVQTAVGVLVDAAEPREVVLPAVVVADAEEPHAKQTVVEQEATEIRREGLHAHAQTVEVVPIGNIAQMLVDERRLKTHGRLGARAPPIDIGLEHPALLDDHVVDVDHRGDTELPVGRLEHRVALVEHGLQGKGLCVNLLSTLTEGIERACAVGDRPGDGQGKLSRLDHRIKDADQREKPIVAE